MQLLRMRTAGGDGKVAAPGSSYFIQKTWIIMIKQQSVVNVAEHMNTQKMVVSFIFSDSFCTQ